MPVPAALEGLQTASQVSCSRTKSHFILLTPSTSLQNPGLLHHVKVMDEEELDGFRPLLLVLKGCFTSASPYKKPQTIQCGDHIKLTQV